MYDGAASSTSGESISSSDDFPHKVEITFAHTRHANSAASKYEVGSLSSMSTLKGSFLNVAEPFPSPTVFVRSKDDGHAGTGDSLNEGGAAGFHSLSDEPEQLESKRVRRSSNGLAAIVIVGSKDDELDSSRMSSSTIPPTK